MRATLITITSLFLFGLSADLRAQQMPDSLIIKLVTVDPGEELTTWWGHTGVIVEDHESGISLFYNYGLFSFEQKNFFTNFAKGRLIFWVGVWRTDLALHYYKSQNRTIIIQTLNLPAARKQDLAAFLAVNVRPENREYLYDHYRDNCATRVRDILDRETDGQFRTFTDQDSRLTLREQTRRFTHRSFFIDWLLMFLMNNTIDQPIKQWDDMFLPMELEKYCGLFSYTDNEGVTRKLVENTTTWYKAEDTYQVPDDPPMHWPRGLILGTMTGIIGVGIGIGAAKGKKPAWRLYGVYLFLLGIWFGIPGTVLFLMSLFTNHVVTWHNENLFLANPVTLLLIPAGIGFLLSRSWAFRYTLRLIYVLTALALILLPLKLLPAFDQDNLLSIVLILPVLLLNSLVWWRVVKPERSA